MFLWSSIHVEIRINPCLRANGRDAILEKGMEILDERTGTE